MRSINLGVIVTQLPSTRLVITLPQPDLTATAKITTGPTKPFSSIPLVGTEFALDLLPGHYALVVDSTIRPGEQGPFKVTTSAPSTFWSLPPRGTVVSPANPWLLGTGTAVVSDGPKDPWPPPPLAQVEGDVVALTNGSPIRDVMRSLFDASGDRGADAVAPAGKLYALLIGIDRYDPGPGQGTAHYSDLQGCVTDVLETEKLLRARVGNNLAVTKLLAPRPGGPGHDLPIAPEEVPTYANIVRAWQRVTETATKADVVYIHYSGHGGRVRTLFPTIKTATGIDESLVPCDINDSEHGRYLRDLEMVLLLDQLAKRQISTTMVIDSCHAGSFTRGDQVRVRTREDGLPDLDVRGSDALGSLVASADSLRAIADRLEHGVSQPWRLGDLDTSITVLAACRQTEGAYEYLMDTGATCGAFTACWLRALADPTLTCRQAFARAYRGVRAMFTNQTPILLGGPDRLVLGTTQVPDRNAVHVVSVTDSTVELDAGAKLMVAKGANFAVLRDQIPETAELAGAVLVEVDSVTPDTATAHRVPGTGNDAPIEVGARAIARAASPRLRRNVRIHAPAPFAAELAVAIAIDPTELVYVADGKPADFQVFVNETTLEAEVADSHGTAMLNVPRTPLGLFNSARAVVEQLVHLARFKNMREFANSDLSASLNKVITAASFRLDVPAALVAGLIEVGDGDSFGLQLASRSMFPLIYYVFDLRPDWSIKLGTSDELEASARVEKFPTATVGDPVSTSSRDTFVILVTRTPVDASLLTLAPIGAPRLSRSPRGPDESMLQQLMRLLQDPTSSRRDAAFPDTPSSSWTVVEVEFETQRTPVAADGGEVVTTPEVIAALGGALVGEELRGDFAAARTAAGAAGGLAEILVDVLSGRVGAARRALAARVDAARDVTAATYVAQRVLSMAVAGDGSFEVAGGMRVNFDDRLAPIALGDYVAVPDKAFTLAGPISGRALQLLGTWAYLGVARYELATLARTADGSGDAGALAQKLETTRAYVARRLAAGDGAPPPWSTTWAALADASLLRVVGDVQGALAVIRTARDQAAATGDAHGAALCGLAEGDALACVIESPATLGLWLSGSWGDAMNNAGDSRRDELEAARASDADVSAARAAYAAAREVFVGENASRGVAAVDLRLAGLAAMAGDLSEARRLAEAAEAQFVGVGDERGAWLARVHGVLAAVAGQRVVDENVIEQIGQWGGGDGDFGFALGLGDLLAHAGRRWLVRDAGYDQAVRCARLAEQLFRKLDAPFAAVVALGDEVAAHVSFRDRAAALAALERADQLLVSLGTRAAPSFSMAVRRAELLLRIWDLASDAGDADGMERAVNPLRALKPLLDLERSAAEAELAVAKAAQQAATAPAEQRAAGQAVHSSELTSGLFDQLQDAVTTALRQTATMAPILRANARDLDPAALPDARAGAWAVAESAVASLGEPDRWFWQGGLRLARGQRAEAAEAFARYFDADPKGARNLSEHAWPELVAQAWREQADLAFAFFARARDPGRARAQRETLQTLLGNDWWKVGDDPWKTLVYDGDVQLADGDPAGALAAYERAQDELKRAGEKLVSDNARIAFANHPDAQRLFAHAARAALELPVADPARAFEFLERGRARALADLLADTRVAIRGEDGIARWRRAIARRDTAQALVLLALDADPRDPQLVDKRQHDLDQAESDVGAAADQARAEAPDRFAGLDTRATVATAPQVAAQLAAGVVAIELSLVDDVLLGWAITRDGITPRIRQDLDDRVLRRAALGFQSACAARGKPLADGEVLASALLAPFAEEISRAAQVVFIVSGELARVPFHALPFAGQLLIEKVAVSYAPSASLLGRLTAVPVKDRPALVVGAPTHMTIRDLDGVVPDRELRELPWARVEAAAVSQLLPGSQLLIDDATRANVIAQLPGFRVVHLATHGLVDKVSPWRSAILLANGEQLSVADLMGVRLDADLVVLSACSSGTGETTRGEELIGLARAMLATGARAVICALWDVDDAATKCLMEEMYRQLQQGGSPAAALRAAQLAVRTLQPPGAAATSRRRNAEFDAGDDPSQDYKHPSFWAPFILIGV